MAVYASADQLAAYSSGTDLSPPIDDDAVESLIRDAEQDVDLAVGPYAKLASGLALDPVLLTVVQ